MKIGLDLINRPRNDYITCILIPEIINRKAFFYIINVALATLMADSDNVQIKCRLLSNHLHFCISKYLMYRYYKNIIHLLID